jgi:hypothetical protein
MRTSNRSIGKYLRIPIHNKVSCAALVSHALNSCDSRNHVPVPSVRCSHTFACVMWKLREDNQSPKIRGFRGLAEAISELVEPFFLQTQWLFWSRPTMLITESLTFMVVPSIASRHLVELVSALSVQHY